MKKKTFKFPCGNLKLVVVERSHNGDPKLMVTDSVGVIVDSMEGQDLVRLSNCLIEALEPEWDGQAPGNGY